MLKPLYHRILVLGAHGAGKTTLSRLLALHYELPIIHLDREFFLPGFVKPDPTGWLERTKRIANSEKWVMDGNYLDTIEFRLARANFIVWIDLPRHICLTRLFVRTLLNLGQGRDDLPENCLDNFRFSNFRNALRWQQMQRPAVIRIVEQAARLQKKVVVLNSRKAVREFARAFPCQMEEADRLT